MLFVLMKLLVAITRCFPQGQRVPKKRFQNNACSIKTTNNFKMRCLSPSNKHQRTKYR